VGGPWGATSGIVYEWGSGFEMRKDLLLLGLAAGVSDATMLHILNFKPHVSSMPFNVSEVLRQLAVRAATDSASIAGLKAAANGTATVDSINSRLHAVAALT
jgi:hypothetical protein